MRGRKGEYESLLADLSAQGTSVRASTARSRPQRGDRRRAVGEYEQHTIEVVVDRLVRRDGIERRLTDSLETALRLAEGVAEVQIMPKAGEESDAEVLTFSQHLACPQCGTSFDELAPRNFSFNSPYGACETCDGLGTTFEVDPELVVPNPDLSLNEGAIAPWASQRTQYFTRLVAAVADEQGIDMDVPWSKLTKAQQNVILHGSKSGSVQVRYKNRYGRQRSFQTSYEGIIPFLRRRHTDAESDRAREQVEGYMREVPCPACGGARLRPASLAVTIDGRNINDLCSLSIGESAKALASLELSERDRMIAERVVKEVNARMSFLLDVGPRLPHALSLGGHAGGWRGAAHPARQPDRQRPRRRAVRARRAVDRPCTSATTAG